MLKVVQERSRVSPAILGRVLPPPPLKKNIFDLKMASFDALLVVFCAIWSYKRVRKTPVIEPAKQRVPGLRPWRPAPTLSPGSTDVHTTRPPKTHYRTSTYKEAVHHQKVRVTSLSVTTKGFWLRLEGGGSPSLL